MISINKVYIDNTFEMIERFLNSSVDLILTDPPYDFTEDQMTFLMTHFQRICNGTIIIFCPPENQWIPKPDQYLFWEKPISTKNTSKSYSRFVEMIYVYHGPLSVWNANRHWSQYTNVFKDLVDDAKLHPYRKPISMLQRLILNHSKPKAVVLDPFCGSGSVLNACKLTGRNWIGIEKERKWLEGSGWMTGDYLP